MRNTHRLLLLVLASLALASLCLLTGGRASVVLAGATQSTPSAFTDIMHGYNTAASQRLESLERDLNQSLPSGVSPVVFVDYDKIATWFGMPEGPATVEVAIGDYLKHKTGGTYSAETLSQLARAMNSLDAEGIVLGAGNTTNCLVVPVYPGISFNSFYAASFHLGSSDLLLGMTTKFGLSTMEFSSFANAHEIWHCFDFRYIRDSGDGLAGAVKQNRTEMFADIGGAMEGIRNEADISLIDRAAAVHAAWAFVTGPAHAKLPEEDAAHFQSIVYATADGLDALKRQIQKMGIEKFRQLNREKMRALDYEITDAHCLTYQQAQALQTYFTTGQASAPVLPLVTRLKAISDASICPSKRAALVDREKCAEDAARNGGLTESALLEKLRARARQLGGATSLANQLKARQEMTDQLRAKLDSPCPRVTEAHLKLLLYTNPHLVPRPGESQH